MHLRNFSVLVLLSLVKLVVCLPVVYNRVQLIPYGYYYPVYTGNHINPKLSWQDVGNFLQQCQILPIEVNVPNTISTIYGGVTSFAGNIIQRIPIVNRWSNPSKPRQKLQIFNLFPSVFNDFDSMETLDDVQPFLDEEYFKMKMMMANNKVGNDKEKSGDDVKEINNKNFPNGKLENGEIKNTKVSSKDTVARIKDIVRNTEKEHRVEDMFIFPTHEVLSFNNLYHYRYDPIKYNFQNIQNTNLVYDTNGKIVQE